jgi:5'-nucleotidase
MLSILHTNDFHGKLTHAVVEAMKPLREKADLYFDCGDLIKAGNLAIPLHADVGWAYLDELQCTASVIGNRETHIVEKVLLKKLEGAEHPIVCGNVHHKSAADPFRRSLILHAKGLTIGVFGVMVPMVTEKMKTQAASAFLWDQPIPKAIEIAAELRPLVDCLIALTHIGYAQDLKLAEACPSLDIILGGHSHTVLEVPTKIGRTAVCQAGSHGRFAGVYHWSKENGLASYSLVPLTPLSRTE